MSATVVNLRTEPYDVRITRPGPWGNPYRVGLNRDGLIIRAACRITGIRLLVDTDHHGGQRHGGQGVLPIRLTRIQAIACFRADLRVMLADDPGFLEPLRGKRLGCVCKPLPCHGDVIVELLG